MSRCNYCSLKIIKDNAKKNNQQVTLLSDATWGMGGVNVYVHPKGVKIKELPGGEDGERKEYRTSWMMEISKNCRC